MERILYFAKKSSWKLHNQNCVRCAAVWIKHEKRTFCSAAIDSFSTFLARTMIGFTVTLNDVNFLVTITAQLFGTKFQQTFKKMRHLPKDLDNWTIIDKHLLESNKRIKIKSYGVLSIRQLLVRYLNEMVNLICPRR